MSTNTLPILTDLSAGVSEFRKNPMALLKQSDGAPIAILNRNQPVFYVVPVAIYEALMDKLEDIELAKIIESRKNQPTIEVNIDDL